MQSKIEVSRLDKEMYYVLEVLDNTNVIECV